MEVIDANWLKKRLDGSRGMQARLAEHVGISPDKMSKILNGQRQVQTSEVPKFISFFSSEMEQQWESLKIEAQNLDPEKFEELRSYARFLLSQQKETAQNP